MPAFLILAGWCAGAAGGALDEAAAAERAHEREFGVFLPVANGGWIVSRNTPVLDGGWPQNRDAALVAEAEGLDFVMSMGKWRGFGGATDHWGTLAGIRHHDGGHRRADQARSRSGRRCMPSCTIPWWRPR